MTTGLGEKTWCNWFIQQQAGSTMQVEEIPLFGNPTPVTGGKTGLSSIIQDWNFKPLNAAGEAVFGHEKGTFFEIIGVKISSGVRERRSWSQPMLKEVGGNGVVLLIYEKFDRDNPRFLIAAREEPGNSSATGRIFLGPSLQASNSSLQRKHGGSAPPRYEFLLRAQHESGMALQPQDGGRYIDKATEIYLLEISSIEMDQLPLLPNERIFCRDELREAIHDGFCNPHLVEALAHLLV